MHKLSNSQSIGRRIIAFLVLVAFLVTGSGIPVRQAYAQELFQLPQPGTRISLSPAFAPPLLKGVKVYPDNPFRLDFILDKGNSLSSADELKTESTRLIKYFLASITVPEKDLWVNLSPYEKDRIIPNAFGVTEMGRDLLAQDYMLKQITASVIYPEEKIGKEFWDKVYAEARKRYGSADVPIDTFNKVWIVPEKAVVYESKDSAYVVESRLKVLLEEDYLALEKGTVGQSGGEKAKETNKLGSEIVREIVIPILEKEVNEGKNFAQLRQVYESLILAIWFKDKIKESLFGKAYVDQEKTGGVDIADKAAKDKIWAQYVVAFKKGAYNYIKEDYDPTTEEVVARKYFSGGAGFDRIRKAYSKTPDRGRLPDGVSDSAMVIESNFKPFIGEASRDMAMKHEIIRLPERLVGQPDGVTQFLKEDPFFAQNVFPGLKVVVSDIGNTLDDQNPENVEKAIIAVGELLNAGLPVKIITTGGFKDAFYKRILEHVVPKFRSNLQVFWGGGVILSGFDENGVASEITKTLGQKFIDKNFISAQLYAQVTEKVQRLAGVSGVDILFANKVDGYVAQLGIGKFADDRVRDEFKRQLDEDFRGQLYITDDGAGLMVRKLVGNGNVKRRTFEDVILKQYGPQEVIYFDDEFYPGGVGYEVADTGIWTVAVDRDLAKAHLSTFRIQGASGVSTTVQWMKAISDSYRERHKDIDVFDLSDTSVQAAFQSEVNALSSPVGKEKAEQIVKEEYQSQQILPVHFTHFPDSRDRQYYSLARRLLLKKHRQGFNYPMLAHVHIMAALIYSISKDYHGSFSGDPEDLLKSLLQQNGILNVLEVGTGGNNDLAKILNDILKPIGGSVSIADYGVVDPQGEAQKLGIEAFKIDVSKPDSFQGKKFDLILSSGVFSFGGSDGVGVVEKYRDAMDLMYGLLPVLSENPKARIIANGLRSHLMMIKDLVGLIARIDVWDNAFERHSFFEKNLESRYGREEGFNYLREKGASMVVLGKNADVIRILQENQGVRFYPGFAQYFYDDVTDPGPDRTLSREQLPEKHVFIDFIQYFEEIIQYQARRNFIEVYSPDTNDNKEGKASAIYHRLVAMKDSAMGSEEKKVLLDEGPLATTAESARRSQEVYKNEIDRLLGKQKSEMGKLLNEYNVLKASLSSVVSSEEKKSINARLSEVEASINGIIDGINKFKGEGEEDLEIPELPLIDEMSIATDRIDRVKRLVLDGQYVPLFFFAGSMTRMRTSLLGIDDEIKNPKSLYVLEVGTALKEFVRANPPSDEVVKETIEEYLNSSGRNLIPMGPRQLRIYRGYIEKLAREKKIKQETALAKQKIVIAVNEKNEADILKDMIKNEFYGFSKSNVLFVSQEALNGYSINDREEIELNENSEKFPFGPAIPIKMLAQEGVAFTLEQNNGGYRKTVVSKSLVDFLGDMGGRYIGTHRVNDLTKFTLDSVLPERPLAYAVEMIDKGNNAVAEMVRNYEGKKQKGAYLFKKGRNLIILEDPKIRGNQKVLDLIEGSSRGGKAGTSYSAFRVVYDLKALKDVVNSDTNWNLRFTGGNLYLESYSGDMTLGPKARTAGFKINDDIKIHDLKAMEIKQLEDAARVLLKSDEDIQEIVWNEGVQVMPIERAAGYKIVRYLSGGSKSRVMLIERDGKLLVRKEEKRFSGDEKVKLMDEILFLKNLPALAKKDFIEIKDSYIPDKEGIVWYEMPYYSPDKWMPLESMIIKGMITPEQTMAIIKGIMSSLASNGLYEEVKPADKQEYIDKLVKKLRQRMGEAATKSKEFMQINGRSTIINGKEYPPLNGMLKEVIGQLGTQLAPEKLYRIHGDLFPENILVNYDDLNNSGVKPGAVLLDPKGGAEGQDLYYELAKMGESIIGLYGYALREYDDYLVGYEHLVREGQVQLDYMVKPTKAVKNYNDISRLFVEYLESSDNPIVQMTGGEFQAAHYFTLLAHTIASTIPFNIHGHEFPKQSILMYIMATKILDQIRKGTTGRVPEVVPLDSPMKTVSGGHSKVVSVLHESIKNGDHVLIGFDIDGTLRDHNEERVRDSMIYHVMELSKRTGPQIDVFINTGNDLDRLKKLFLDRYHTVTSESGLFDPNYYIYLTVQEAAKTYKYYPVADKYELLYTADVISPETEDGVRRVISDLMKEFKVPQVADQIQNQGGVRIKFTPPGVNAGADEREDFFRKDQREGLRVKYQEYLIPRLRPLGLFPYIKGRTSIDIMSTAINKKGGIRQLSSWVAQQKGKLVRSLMFDDEVTELADSVDLLLWVGAKRPSEDIKNAVFNGEAFGTQATANFIYEIIDYLSNELIPKDEDAAMNKDISDNEIHGMILSKLKEVVDSHLFSATVWDHEGRHKGFESVKKLISEEHVAQARSLYKKFGNFSVEYWENFWDNPWDEQVIIRPPKNGDLADSAQNGGIDLTRDKMNIQMRGAENGVQFNFDPAMIQQLQNASGLTPVIIGIHPMTTSVPMFLGLQDGADKMAAVH